MATQWVRPRINKARDSKGGMGVAGRTRPTKARTKGGEIAPRIVALGSLHSTWRANRSTLRIDAEALVSRRFAAQLCNSGLQNRNMRGADAPIGRVSAPCSKG